MENYYKTAKRTSKSSMTLHQNNEYFNSCYLGGYVLECYTKLLLKKALNLSDLDLKKEFSHDIKKLNKLIKTLSADPSAIGLLDTKYLIDINLNCTLMISGNKKWDPNKRYYIDETIWDSDTSEKYQTYITLLMTEISNMKLDGVIV